MSFTPGEVANYAVRVFLERIGRRYDEIRGFKRFNEKDASAIKTVAAFFNNACPYCEGPLTGISADHLVPTNMTSLGLHAWGNVVWACTRCNGQKHAQDWREFLRSTSTNEEFTRRSSRIQEFRSAYRYDTDLRLSDIAAALHEEVKLLIERKVREAEPLIRGPSSS